MNYVLHPLVFFFLAFQPRLPRPFCFLPSVSSRTNSTLVEGACHCVSVFFFFFGVV
ncbi:Uncharacterized protein APZ42_003376 [Daphnia magna]|uniref:Uncharacterized protein n=1 Tax=Daphnia magna TaxID=35525 RepID=A0A162C2S1_9CRUS|nr:Uncharacterized protein APZ42_003376 [Daphnia magna]